MDQLSLDGKIYRRYNKLWVDLEGFSAPEIIQARLNKLFAESVDPDVMTVEELVEHGDRYKATNSIGLAIQYYEAAIFRGTVREARAVFPRLTSCYRKQGMPQKAIDILTKISGIYGKAAISAALLVSVAAAYCDLGDYDRAKKCCDRAFAQGDRSGELSAAYGRIKKESDS